MSGKLCDYVQLHGNEGPEIIAKLRELLPYTKIIKAVSIKNSADFEKYRDLAPLCDLMLLDSKSPGSGKSFDWDSIPSFVDKGRTLISGGIGIDNLNYALRLGFAGVDMNSKLEGSVGVKDPALVKKAFEIIKEF